MMNKRRIVSLILALCIFVSSMQSLFAAEADNTDVNTMAMALNKLSMITGDGKGNYNLPGALKRSEAATFIIRLMGKYDYVLQNSKTYINTGFSDVKETDWFASYVGYCKENSIISGIGQNKFDPKGNITEKAFLGMTLKVLGYTSDDFSWSTVYQKAYEIGLVTGDSYKDRTEDNREYIREEVVRVMYRALGLKLKNSDTTLIKKLILDGSIDPQLATEAGFTSDEVPTAISQINVLGEQWITFKLNEQIRPIGESNIQIYENDSKAALSFKIVQQTDTEVKIKTDTQKTGIQYTLKLKSITDMQDNVVKEVSTIFKGFDNKPIESDYFKISKVAQKSGNELEVYFTHPININVEQPEFYSIYQGDKLVLDGNKSNMTVKVIEGQKNMIVINTRDFNYQGDMEYTLKIKGSLVSSYGTNLGMEAGDQKSFIAKTMQLEKFKVVGLNAYNNKVVKLEFNKPLNKAIAENLLTYKITQMSTGIQFQIVKAAIADSSFGKECAVVLTTANPMESKYAYNMEISYLLDITRQEVIEKQQFTFNPATQSSSDLKIVSVVPVDQSCLKVTFDKEIDQKSAEDVSNFTILCLNNTSYFVKPIKAMCYADDPKSVKLFIESTKPMVSTYLYKVNVATTFLDFTGTKIPIPLEYTFVASSTSKSRIEISKAVFIAKDTLKISFNKEIALDVPNILTSSYYIQDTADDTVKKMPLALNYIDNNTIVLKFDKIDFTKQYFFKYSKIKDITGEEFSGDQIYTAIVQGQ